MTEQGVLGQFFDFRLPDLVERMAAESPQRVVVRTTSGDSRTAAQLWDGVRAVAGGLVSLGVPPGARVAALLDNCLEMIELFFASALGGHVFVPMNTAWRGASLRSVVDDCEPSVVLTSPARTAEVRKILGADVRLVTVGRDDTGEKGGLAFEDLKARGGTWSGTAPGRPCDLTMLLYTSGTTGASKGNMLTHRSCLWMAATASDTLGYTPDDMVHSCLPLFHANALLCGMLGAFLRGSSFVLAPRFTASGFWAEVAAAGATHTALLGSMIPILLAQPTRPAESEHAVRVAYCAPLPEHVAAFEERFGLKCAATYGLTDANILTVRPADDSDVQSCGVASPDWELQIVDDEGRPVPAGQPGELRARPRRAFIASLGYWRRPEATVELWRDLWIHTGDILFQDDAGRFHFVDRKKDAIRKGGENVSSAEVEDTLTGHPAVGEAAVFAVPSELAEDEVMAVLTLVDGAEATPEEIFAYCVSRLPFFAVPRYLQIVGELPRTENHRIRKAELRSRGVTPSTWDAGPVTRRRIEELVRR